MNGAARHYVRYTTAILLFFVYLADGSSAPTLQRARREKLTGLNAVTKSILTLVDADTNATANNNDYVDLTGLDYSDDIMPDVAYDNFDRSGQPRSVTDATGAHTLEYDHAGRLFRDTGTAGLLAGVVVSNRLT